MLQFLNLNAGEITKWTSITSLLLSGIITFTMFDGTFVPKISLAFIMMILSIGIYVIGMQLGERDKRYDSIMLFSGLLYFTNLLGSMVYTVWTFEFFPAIFLLRLIMVVLLLIDLYAVFVYVRLDYNYRKKKLNQRIEHGRKETWFEKQLKKLGTKEKLNENGEFSMVLGISTDKEAEF
ncbi:hypothetical protein ABC382_00400 [Lysinibacillus sp. 1P01SD]|uniref:hypothetical protein n=1 Tax=Lysinibacillus sp. 1P01SD TaxID=3132285 RepID=UPI0039A36664